MASLTLRNINLDINDGEFVVFVGPSGCGKSTLMRNVVQAWMQENPEHPVTVGQAARV